ncbi:MAG: nuclear transport factor 2 family protein [Acidimicrobiales bacterium]
MTALAPVPAVPVDDAAVASATALADLFLAGTNALEAVERGTAIAGAWQPDGHFVDPLHEATGHGELDVLMATVHRNFPGYVFHRTGPVEPLGRWFRFGWEFRDDAGTILAAGTDIAESGDDGRLVRIVSFYDHLATT